MSDQWVDKEGRLRNSSGRYPTGQRSPASIEMEEDDEAYEAAKGYVIFPAPDHAWAFSCQPTLGAVLVNEKTDVCVGLHIDHARVLLGQLRAAVILYDKVRQDMIDKREETNKRLLDNAGITLGVHVPPCG